MDMRQFIQNEYEIFCTGKLAFELIFLDSFDYLWRNNFLPVTRADIINAANHVTDYRRNVLRKYCKIDHVVRQTSTEPVTMEDKRRHENKIRKWHTKQLLVYWWYEKKMKEGVKNIFLEIPQTV